MNGILQIDHRPVGRSLVRQEELSILCEQGAVEVEQSAVVVAKAYLEVYLRVNGGHSAVVQDHIAGR